MKTPLLRLFPTLLLVLFALPVLAQEQNTLIEISPGLTKVDLTGDGKPETILKAWRENFNAHGYYVTEFLQPAGGNKNDEYNIIGIEYGSKASSPFVHELTSSHGADCVMHDYRLLFIGKQAYLIEGKLIAEESYCNSRPVTFRFFRVAHNEEGIPGTTEYYFEPIKEWITEDNYNDVKDAFDKNSENLISKIQ